ncbi:MAG TPA: Rieske 2Fe-2S domain-containing protein [Ilumatobacter sp.]|nr:Rieske 2Fe-2S domain-containing protein [Ilumatobacter sp.]
MTATTLSMRPTGWFQLCWSHDVVPGAVHSVRAFGEDLVVYRTMSGMALVVDAYCPHLGAHLGKGGTVVDECLQCPFHGWRFGVDGVNVFVPYADRPNRAARLGTRHAVERNEGIFVWHDATGRDPLWELPDIFVDLFDDATADDYYPAAPFGCLRVDGEIHPQYVVENGVDAGHFLAVHRMGSVPEMDPPVFGEWHYESVARITFGAGKVSTKLTPDGPVPGSIRTHTSGLGVGMACFHGLDTERTRVACTPIDDRESMLFSTTWLPRRDGDDSAVLPAELEKRVEHANDQFLRDVPIWSNLRYTASPKLVASEVVRFTALRKWAQRFYPTIDQPTIDQPTIDQEVLA